MLCQYSDILGKAGEGVHSYRVGPFAIVDVILTIILALVISYIIDKNILIIFAILWVLAEILHGIFCVETTFWRLVK